MEFISDLLKYKSKCDRIEGWRPLLEVGLNIPRPLKIITHKGFLFYKKRGLSGKLKEEILKAFKEIRKANPKRGVYAGRGYFVPGFCAPPGPRSSSVKSEKVILEEVEKLFDFAIKNKFDKEGSEINVIMHPFVNPIFPLSGGCITPSRENPNELIVEAIYGNDEGIQTFYHDTFNVDVERMVISGKVIQNKPRCLQANDDFKYETLSVPKRYQDIQCIDDLTVLTIARDFKKLIDKYGLYRVEFAVSKDGVYFRDCTPFEFTKEDKRSFINTRGTILKISNIEDIEELKKDTTRIVYIDPDVIVRRNMDLLTSIAYNIDHEIVVLYPGSATTAHAITILREKGHTVVYVRNESFETGDRVFIGIKGNHLVANKITKDPSNLVLTSKNISEDNLRFVGGKTARIKELENNKVLVPKYLSVTTEAFDYFVDENNLQDEIETASIERNKGKLIGLCAALKKKIGEGKIPSDIENLILKGFDGLGVFNVAVRSSANIEDGIKASFAGQFETYLNVDRENLVENIKKCWGSLFNNSAVTYALYNNIPLYAMKMGVLVMEMLSPVKAGVLFTKDLIKDDLKFVVIEGVEGLGDKVVDGLSQPDRVVVEKSSGKVASERQKPILTPNDIRMLLDEAMRIERDYKSPQDIEWAIVEGDKLFVLQTRPITS